MSCCLFQDHCSQDNRTGLGYREEQAAIGGSQEADL